MINEAKNTEPEIQLPSGHMSLQHLEALLQTVPMEMTFVDETDHNRYFSRGNGSFPRSLAALDGDVYACHSAKSVPAVRRVIESLRSGEKDCVEYWIEKKGEPVLVRYLAVRNDAGEYLGTLECVQNMSFAKEHFCSPGSKGSD